MLLMAQCQEEAVSCQQTLKHDAPFKLVPSPPGNRSARLETTFPLPKAGGSPTTAAMWLIRRRPVEGVFSPSRTTAAWLEQNQHQEMRNRRWLKAQEETHRETPPEGMMPNPHGIV
ncbi:hypothetical protein KIL84_008906 [Mauremys mutica]|uniref:Uncharacterized protein n=1 Tax=Mauremys mutica TaxID=74926 RepID=A0A9D4AZU9_9SAUR|nr:hypothetical protein KIL84_008906 [Mauremys mutica]